MNWTNYKLRGKFTANNFNPPLKLSILGTRGIPAKHGGFETFAEHLSLFLQKKGWDVTVYCQKQGRGLLYDDYWNGIRRVHIQVAEKGAKGTIIFDWLSTLHAVRQNIPILTLGYNTAIFCALYRFKGIKNVINMDGIEWRREKWTFKERAWLYLNEKIGAWLGNHLIADHPEIKKHLSRFVQRRKITIIPYSAKIIERADLRLLDPFGLKQGKYAILIARPEPENSILEIVRAYSVKKRGMPLVILGNYEPGLNQFQKTVLEAAGDEIKFLGAIYNQPQVQALRFFARFYIHGHTVGGTNPSLVEALGASSPVLAHDNKFNRWVAGKGALYFSTEAQCKEKIDLLIENEKMITEMKHSSLKQFHRKFSAKNIYGAYEKLLRDKAF